MGLSKQALKEFQQIYQRQYGEKISRQEAENLAINLLMMFSAVYKPIKKDEYAKQQSQS